MSNEKSTMGMPHIPQKRVDKFWGYVELTANPDKCWDWKGGLNGDYGSFTMKCKSYKSHRVAYYLGNKIDPIGKLVCHNCDNGKCCNPSHLFLGTALDNLRDMISKNRHWFAIADRNGMSKLSYKDVIKIRELFSNGTHSRKELSEIYNHDYSVICKIIKGKLWASIK